MTKSISQNPHLTKNGCDRWTDRFKTLYHLVLHNVGYNYIFICSQLLSTLKLSSFSLISSNVKFTGSMSSSLSLPKQVFSPCIPVSYTPIKLQYIPVTAKWNSLNSMVLLKYGFGANVKLILYPDLISSNSSTSN